MSLTHLDQLRQSRDSTSTVFYDYLNACSRISHGVFAFVEGRDDPAYYRPIIRRHLKHNVSYLVFGCGGKSQVYEIRSKVLLRRSEGHCYLFLVDKDLDDIVASETDQSEPDIYTTKTYSIENEFVNRSMVEDVCIEILGMSPGPAIEDVLNRFSNELLRFHRAATILMAWIVSARNSGFRPQLNNLRIGQFLRVTDELRLVHVKPLRADLARQLNVPESTITFKEAARLARKLWRTYEPKAYVRGKFEIWFLSTFIDRVSQLHKLTARVTINQTNAVCVLGPRAREASGLREFLMTQIPKEYLCNSN